MTPEALVWSGTSWVAVPFVPEIRLLTAAEPFGLWDLTERDAPPFWAFPWAGGQALARYVLDQPAEVAGKLEQSWYMCYVADANRPIVIAVTVPQGGFGAETAAPIARLIASSWFNAPKRFIVGTSKTH